MADRAYLGQAVDIAEIDTLTLTNAVIGSVFTATINNKEVSFAATVATVENAATGLANAWNNSTIPEFAEVTAGAVAGVITLIGDTSGRSFIVTASTGGAGSATNEIQTLTITGGTPTTGNFVITDGIDTTDNLAFDIDATTLDTRLEADITAIGVGDVTVGGGPLPGTDITIELTGALANTNFALLIANDVDMDQSAVPSISETTQGRSGVDDMVQATTQAATGKNHFDNQDNWTGNTVPVAADNMIFDARALSDLKYALAQTEVAFGDLVIKKDFIREIGLSETNSDGTTNYSEYRDTYFQMDSSDIFVGDGIGNGSGRLKIDSAAIEINLVVIDLGSTAETGIPALLWKGSNAANVVTVNKGHVGCGFFDGETAVIATLRVGFVADILNDSIVVVGSPAIGASDVSNLDMSGGTATLFNFGAIDDIDQTGGELTIAANTAVITVKVDGGTFLWNSNGTLTTVDVGPFGILDTSRDIRPKTLTTLTMHSGAQLKDPQGLITFTNDINLDHCGISDVKIDVSRNIKFKPVAI